MNTTHRNKVAETAAPLDGITGKWTSTRHHLAIWTEYGSIMASLACYAPMSIASPVPLSVGLTASAGS